MESRGPSWWVGSRCADSDGGDQHDAQYCEYKGWLKDRYAEYGKINTFFR